MKPEHGNLFQLNKYKNVKIENISRWSMSKYDHYLYLKVFKKYLKSIWKIKYFFEVFENKYQILCDFEKVFENKYQILKKVFTNIKYRFKYQVLKRFYLRDSGKCPQSENLKFCRKCIFLLDWYLKRTSMNI